MRRIIPLMVIFSAVVLIIVVEVSLYFNISQSFCPTSSSRAVAFQKQFTPPSLISLKWESLNKQMSDLFTPPPLLCDSKGNWILRNKTALDANQSFGLELIEIKKKPYKLQLSGYVYIKEDASPNLFFLDTDTENIIQTKLGEILPLYNVQVVAFNPPSGSQAPNVEIQDNSLNKRVQLAFNQIASEFRYEAIFQNIETGEKIVMNTSSAQLQLGYDQIWLRELDFESQIVTLEKYSPNNDSTQLQVFKSRSIANVDQVDSEISNDTTIIQLGV